MTRDQYISLLAQCATQLMDQYASADGAVAEAKEIIRESVKVAEDTPADFFYPPPTAQPEIDPPPFETCSPTTSPTP